MQPRREGVQFYIKKVYQAGQNGCSEKSSWQEHRQNIFQGRGDNNNRKKTEK